MAGTYADMRTRIGDEIADTTLTSQVNLAILSAIKHYSKERWYFTETSANQTCASGTQGYNLPGDFKAMERVRVTFPIGTTSYYGLDYISFNELNAMTTVGTLIGPPAKYCIYAQQILLWPIPDASYVLTEYYENELTTLSADSDTNAWLVDGEELIRARAKWDIYLNTIHEPEEAQICKAIEMEAYNQLRGSSTDRTVKGRIRAAYL